MHAVPVEPQLPKTKDRSYNRPPTVGESRAAPVAMPTKRYLTRGNGRLTYKEDDDDESLSTDVALYKLSENDATNDEQGQMNRDIAPSMATARVSRP